MSSSKNIAGYVTFVLHAHLPYVVHHGMWPHGQDWLHEAAAETYLPLLRTFAELERQGAPLKANVNLSPVLLEQLAHPEFKAGFGKYLDQKIAAARKDEDLFIRRGHAHFIHLAQFWRSFYEQARAQFDQLNGDLIAGFKHFYDSGAIEIITCGATHGYFALLGTDASIRAQVRVGVRTHERFFGRKPKGIWLPECSYRPAGPWKYPVPVDGLRGAFQRQGVEQILAENGIQFFFVDTHLVEANVRFLTPYELLAGDVPIAIEEETRNGGASPYLAYYADTPQRDRARVAFFTRDARTGIQVWSGIHGYPGDPVYLEFHKKHWPGGHRYWQVTQSQIDLGGKTPYFPECAKRQTAVHADHFTQITHNVLEYDAPHNDAIPILTAPFDAELFGHWWFEGPEWLKNVALAMHAKNSGVELITCSEYLERQKPPGFVPLPEGSWGRNGTHEVWLNPDNEWTWTDIYPAELALQQIAEGGKWRQDPTARRLTSQLCRELLLLEASDWQFLITTKHARDYAEKRFKEHLDDFTALLEGWRKYETTGQVPERTLQKLAELEKTDSIFPEVSPEVYLT